jgi:transcriptional antiterminator RfaH
MAWHVRNVPLRGWGLVTTKQGQERLAKLNLEKQSVRCLLPKARENKQHVRLTALFPGYLFVQPPERWAFMRSTFGVRNVITSGDRPSLIPPKVMRELLRSLNDEGYIDLTNMPEVPKPLAKFDPGDPLTIVEGVFKSHAAVYKALAPSNRIRVVLEFMGQETEAEIDRRAVEPGSRQPGRKGPVR